MQVIRLSTTSPDKTWDSFFSALYGTIEQNLGIICACMVTLRPLFRGWRWFSGGEAEESQGELQLPKPPRQVIDKDQIPTITSYVQDVTINDVELGKLDKNRVIGPTELESELRRASSTRLGKDGSYASTMNDGTRTSERGEDLERMGSSRTLL